MEQQRPLRLGDLVDDYCPRERRVTNHAIVAIVEDVIRQTRCSACEADHVYKGGKAPVRKKKDPKATLYEQVLANVTGPAEVPPPEPAAPEPVAVAPVPAGAPVRKLAPKPVPKPVPTAAPAAAAPVASIPAPPAPQAPPAPVAPVVDEVWSLNRPLIRASLPKNDNQPLPVRAIAEFTMHQRNGRGSQNFRGGGPNGNSNGNSGGFRGGFRSEGQGQGENQPSGPGGQRPSSGRRRRRPKAPRPPE